MNKIFFYLIYHEFLLQNDVSNVYMSNYNAKLTFFVYFRNLLFWVFFLIGITLFPSLSFYKSTYAKTKYYLNDLKKNSTRYVNISINHSTVGFVCMIFLKP